MNKELILEKINQFFNSRGQTPQEFLETDDEMWMVNPSPRYVSDVGEMEPQYWHKKDIEKVDSYKD